MVLAGSVEDHKKFVDEAGSTGIQYMPIRSLRHSRMGQRLAAAGLITSLHQSFLTMQATKDYAYHAVIPTLQDSIPDLAAVQAVARKKLPMVVHPNEQYLNNQRPARYVDYSRLVRSGMFGPLLHQPTVEVLDAWNALGQIHVETEAEVMLREQKRHGFDGVALDLYHLTAERAGLQRSTRWCADFAANLAAWGALDAPGEVQLSYRPDFGEDISSLDRAVHGSIYQSPQGQILAAIKHALPANQSDIRVTMEVPPAAFHAVGVTPAEGNYVLAQKTREIFES